MTPSREYSVVLPLQPLPVGRWIERSSWPAHITACGNFRSGVDDVDVLAAVLRRIAEATTPIVATVTVDALFGPSADVPVQLVESVDLHRLHVTLGESLGSVAPFELVSPENHGTGYRPHLTVVDGERLEPGAIVDLGTLLLVEIGPDGDHSVAVPVATAELGARESRGSVSAERAASTWSRLRADGIRTWVIGGWGIDALLGEQTREHHDLDLFVLDEDLKPLLDTVGSSLRYLWSENRWLDRRPSAFVVDVDGIDVDVHVVGLAGAAVRLRSSHSIELPIGALTATGRIAGHDVDCATVAAQLVMHSGYDLPEEHRRDIEALRR